MITKKSLTMKFWIPIQKWNLGFILKSMDWMKEMDWLNDMNWLKYKLLANQNNIMDG